MIRRKKSLDNTWVILFHIGYFLILIISLTFILNLPFESQPFVAITASFAYLISSFLFARMPNKPQNFQSYHIRLFWVGIAEIILAILFWSVIKPRTEIALWGTAINFMFGTVGILIIYGAMVFYFFPGFAQIRLTPKSDPINEFDQSLQEIIMEGRKQVGNPTALALLVFAMIGAIGVFLSIFMFRELILSFFSIPIFLGLFISITLNIILTYKWQKWARQSGIPEEKLKEAAKSAGLWWPQTGNKS